MKFQNKLNSKKLVSRIVILTVLVLLANYFVILSEFSGIVLATFNEERIFISEEKSVA